MPKKRARSKPPNTSKPSTSAAEKPQIKVPANRIQEFQEYLQLFGYKPTRTILQAHRASLLGRRRVVPQRVREARERARKRYGGTTFTVVGRTHDHSFIERLIAPKYTRNSDQQRERSYVGYLFGPSNQNSLAPHELLPLDFTPTHVEYPEEWKKIYPDEGILIALHVPVSFAKDKNRLMRALYREGKKVDVREKWTFIEKVKEFAYKPKNRNETD
jgi:hypothetical protein